MLFRPPPLAVATLAVFAVFLLVLFLIGTSSQNRVIYPLQSGIFGPARVLGDYQYTADGEPPAKLGLVYGFLPYWNVDNYQVSDAITHLSFFRLAVDRKGEIITKAGDGGYQIYNSERVQHIFDQVNKKGLKLEMTFFSSHSDEIYQLIKCESCHDTLVENIAAVIEADRLDGVNLDFEFLGTLTAEEKDQFTSLVFKIKNMMTARYPRTKLSIDDYGGPEYM